MNKKYINKKRNSNHKLILKNRKRNKKENVVLNIIKFIMKFIIMFKFIYSNNKQVIRFDFISRFKNHIKS